VPAAGVVVHLGPLPWLEAVRTRSRREQVTAR
jgi:hypothetical protein